MQSRLAPRSRPHKGMLFLRRKVGERIVIFDSLSELWIEVLDIDPEQRYVVLSIGNRQPIGLELYGDLPLLQGDGRLRVHTILEYQDGTCEVSLGIHAPQTMTIRREELIKGTTPDQRAAMVR